MTASAILRKSGAGHDPALSAPTFAPMATTVTDALGADGFTWAQASPIVVDHLGKVIVMCQQYGQGLVFVFSNDNLATWQDNTGHTNNAGDGPIEAALTRTAIAHDPVNDVLHALHAATDGADGIIYRRYMVSRDGSGNITAIVRDYASAINLQMELDGAIAVDKPILLWLDDPAFGAFGALVALWSVTDADTGEVHGSMRVLSGDAADGEGASWVRLDGGATSDASTIASTRNVALSVLSPAYGASLSVAAHRMRNGARAKDLYLFWHVNGAGEGLHWRRLPWDATGNNWTAGTAPALISATIRAGSHTVRQLWEVLTQPAQDGAGAHVWIGFANWKDNTAGDTWTIVAVDTTDAIGALADVYSCGGVFAPALYALTGDICYDTGARALVVSYVHSGGVGSNDAAARLYRDGNPLGAEVAIMSADDVDIPILYQNPRTGGTRVAGKLACVFRDTTGQAPPYHGHAGTITLG